jgi:hypothetical protein
MSIALSVESRIARVQVTEENIAAHLVDGRERPNKLQPTSSTGAPW